MDENKKSLSRQVFAVVGGHGAKKKKSKLFFPHHHHHQTTTTLILILDDRRPLCQVDTVQELADVLFTHVADHVDESSRPRNQLNIISGNHKLVFHGRRPLDGHASEHSDNADPLLSQEVADLHDLATTFDVDVDGEVGVDEAHLVFEALGHAFNHVGDVRSGGADCGELLAGPEGLLDAEELRLGAVGVEETKR